MMSGKLLFHFILRKTPPSIAILLLNLTQYFYSADVRFYISRTGLASCSEPGGIVSSTANIFRLLTYRLGICERRRFLLEEYLISDRVLALFSSKPVVIDCGANVGDFTLGMVDLLRDKSAKIFAIEPSPAEFRALSRNCEGLGNVYVINKAFSENSGTYELFVKSDTADSSLEPIESSTDRIKVTTTSFADFYNDTLLPRGISEIDLFKLEAEGHEFEILMGMRDLLKSVRFITCDLGPERLDLSLTVPACLNYLYEYGFRITAHNHKRSIFLLYNSILVDWKDDRHG